MRYFLVREVKSMAFLPLAFTFTALPLEGLSSFRALQGSDALQVSLLPHL